MVSVVCQVCQRYGPLGLSLTTAALKAVVEGWKVIGHRDLVQAWCPAHLPVRGRGARKDEEG